MDYYYQIMNNNQVIEKYSAQTFLQHPNYSCGFTISLESSTLINTWISVPVMCTLNAFKNTFTKALKQFGSLKTWANTKHEMLR